MNPINKTHRVNEMIRVREVRVIGEDGSQLGILPVEEALALAQRSDLDLVEVAPNVRPPVCRIMDYGKFKFKQSKKMQEARKKQRAFQLKEVRMRPKTEEHDYLFKARNVRKFLSDGHKVKVSIRFKGREMAHTDLGRRILDRLTEDMGDIGAVENPPKQEGYSMVMTLMPRS